MREAVEKLAADFERHLGDPDDPATPVSFAAALDHDDREAYPHGMMAALHAWDLQDYSVPVSHGGRAHDLQDSFELLRLVARRDAGLATSFATTSLALTTVLIGGNDEQKSRYGKQVSGRAKFSWGLSERDHGSDVVATETSARPVPGGYLVNGEKWPIGNSAIGDVVALFARTGERGPTAYSVLMVDRHKGVPSQRERLHGIRAVDNGGIRFDDVFVPADALIGREGQGLEIALKASLTARAMVPAIALGCADTALRRTLDFALERQIFGKRLIDIPPTRQRLAECVADVLICDALAISAVRALHTTPSQASVTSSVSKFLVPTILERTISDLAVVLGARHFLRSDPRYGIFGKIRNDVWITHFAEGNTLVNLKNVVVQLAMLPGDTELDPRTFDLDAELPPFAPDRLDLRSRDGDSAVRALTGRFRDELPRVQSALQDNGPQSAEAFALAEQYAVIHAAACLTHLGGLPPAVLRFCLDRLWRRLYPLAPISGTDEVIEHALRLHAEHRLFSHRNVLLGEASGE